MAKKAYIGVPKFEPVFSYNTWPQIIEACQKNEVPDTWLVGDQKTMTIGDRDYLIDIIGKHHDTYADGSGTAPLTFGMHDCYGTTYGMGVGTNNGGYGSTPMHKETLPSIKSLMPYEVQSAIVPVGKKSSAGNKSTEIETISCDLFMLAEIEVHGSLTHAAAGEGSQYDYFKNGGSKVKNVDGVATMWRLRSPAIASTYSYCAVNADGNPNYVTASNVIGVVFGFCFGGASELNSGGGVARKIKKGYIGSGVPLPNGYSELEYIESTGSQYIDTLIYPDDTFGYKVDMEQIDSYGEQCPLGCMGNDNRFVGVYFISRATGTSTESILVGWATLANPFNYPNGFSTNQRVISRCNYMNDRKVVFNGYEVLDITNHHIQGTIENSLYLFNRNFRVGGLFKGRIYNAVISKGDEIYADFIPCVNPNGVVGMYDIVRHLFFSSPNSVAFIAGDAKPGVARKIRRAYRGDKNGVAQLCYSTTDYFIPAGADKLVTADNKTFCVR